MTRILLRIGAVAAVLGLLALWSAVPRAQAAAIVVNSRSDFAGLNNECTLREAIINANNNADTYADCAAGSGADTISFSIRGTITVLGSNPLPAITDNLTMSGPGAGSLIITSSNAMGEISIEPGVTANLFGLTIQNFGGIHNRGGNLTVSSCVLSHNSGVHGAVLFNISTLTVRDSIFSNNRSRAIYNAVNAPLIVTGSTFSGNTAWSSGVGIFNNGKATVSNSVFSNNHARTMNGGGIDNGGSLTVMNSTFMNNTSDYRGGGIVQISGMLTLAGVLFTGNSAADRGAAVYSEGGGSVSSSCFENNIDPTHVLDVNIYPGTPLTAYGNWWNVPAGPNTSGGETTNFLVEKDFLTSRPACGAGAGGGEAIDLCVDDRLNCRFGDDYAIIYNAQDDHGHPALHTYCVDEAGNGVLGMIVTSHDLEGIASKPRTNTQVRKGDTNLCRTPVSFWVLTTGEYQVNIGPDYKGDLIRMIFNGLPPQGRHFKKCNVLTSFGLCSQ